MFPPIRREYLRQPFCHLPSLGKGRSSSSSAAFSSFSQVQGDFPNPRPKYLDTYVIWNLKVGDLEQFCLQLIETFESFCEIFWHILAGCLSTGQLVLLNAGNHRKSCHHHHHDLPIREYLRQAFCDPPSPWKGREGSL